MTMLEKARALREDTSVHYNCCQAVLMAAAPKLGLSEEQAAALGAHFGSGMRHGATCGALTGALMAAGLAGKDGAAASQLISKFRITNGCTDCAGLLTAAKQRGEEKKAHCDRLVYESVEALEELLAL